MIHKFKYAEQVPDQIKISKVDITAAVLQTCMESVNLAVEGAGDHLGVDTVTAWKYKDKSSLLYAYVINKLNVDLYDKTVGVADKHGFELYRQFCQLVDTVPRTRCFTRALSYRLWCNSSAGRSTTSRARTDSGFSSRRSRLSTDRPRR